MLTQPFRGNAQPLNTDTLAIQDFEINTSPLNWSYTVLSVDSPGFSSGFSPSAGCSPINSPLGIDGSRAWNSTQVSSGVTIRLANINIPIGTYDSIRFAFRLAAFNLIGTAGGPDNLDYVAVKYSIDNGATFIPRLRIRGAVANNSTWGYDATGIAKVDFLPSNIEQTFAPTNSGLQTSEGYSYCEITFPGNIQNLSFEVTGRSSSSSDTWLIDNIMLTGENNCLPVVTNINASACNQYVSPSGNIYNLSGVYSDTLSGSNGCDSIVITNLVVTSVNASITIGTNSLLCNQANANYQWFECTNGLQPIFGANAQSYTPITGGSFAVAAQYQGCSDTSVCVTVSFTGLPDPLSNYCKVYPNPSKGILNLEIPSASKGLRYTIFFPCGKKIKDGLLTAEKTELDLSDLCTGVYFIKTNASKIEKLIIQH
ncbi:MAG: T9SS type A sorting domain-containing protein [Bacteroidota bacterium]